MVSDINEFILTCGYDFKPEHLDGQFHEFKTEKTKGWYVGQALEGKIVLTFGDWLGDKHIYKNGYHDGDHELSKIQREQARLEKIKKQEFVAPQLEKDFNDLISVGPSPYLQKKKINQLFTCKTKVGGWGADLVIPMYDVDGKIWNLQRIQEDGQKLFSPGARTEGVFHVIGEVKDVIYITEGFATGASVHLATSQAVVVSFSASNLTATAKAIRGKYPKLPIVIARDDDHTKSPNAGKESALEAASESSASICSPDFGPKRGEGHTDWSDLFVIRGIEEVRNQLNKHTNTPPATGFDVDGSSGEGSQTKTEKKERTQAKSKSRARLALQVYVDPWVNGLAPIPEKWVDGKLIPPTEFEVASELFNYYKITMLRQDNDLFKYTGTHWKLQTVAEIDKLKLQIQVLYAGLAKAGQLASALTQFIAMLSSPPHNLFTPQPHRANFLNGTLHILGKEMVFKPHHPLDFCTNVIPIEYDTTRSIRNLEFEEMLGRILGDDPEKESKLRTLKQIYGACLFPMSAKFFLVYGPGGTGKSSLLIPAQRLVHEDNWCAVDPSEFSGFNMETMAGKLVNFVNDIDVTKPMVDSIVKKTWDRMPIRIDRKNEKAIYAPLPAVHVFSGNAVPSSYDRNSGAHERRWVLLEIDRYKIGEAYIQDFAHKVFDANPQGILNWALEGAQDNIDSNFKYHSPESSKAAVLEMSAKYDAVEQFLKDVRGEGDKFEGVLVSENGKIERKILWDNFKEWYGAHSSVPLRMSKTSFYSAFALKIGKPTKTDGVYYFKGLCVDEDAKRKKSTGANGVGF